MQQNSITVMPMFSTRSVKNVWILHSKPILPEATCPAPSIRFAPPLALHPFSFAPALPPALYPLLRQLCRCIPPIPS